MMRSAASILGIVTACAACCALPLALPLLSAFGLGSLLDWRVGLAAAVAAFATLALMRAWRRPEPAYAPTGDSCGCATGGIAARAGGIRPQEDA